MPLQGTLLCKRYPSKSKKRPEGLSRLRAHTITLVGDRIYLIGGYGRSGHALYTFSLSKRKWKTLPGIQYRYGHCCVLVYDELYVLGGGRYGERQYTIEAYDLLLNSAGEIFYDLPFGTSKAVFVESRGEIVIYAERETAASVVTFNIKTHKLTSYQDAPGNRHPPGTVVSVVEAGNKLFFLLSYRARFRVAILRLLHRLSTRPSAYWEKVETKGPSVYSRFASTLHRVNGMLLFYGGGSNTNVTDRMMIFDEQSREIVDVGPNAMAGFVRQGPWPGKIIRGPSTVVCGGKLIVLTWNGNEDMIELDILRKQ